MTGASAARRSRSSARLRKVSRPPRCVQGVAKPRVPAYTYNYVHARSHGRSYMQSWNDGPLFPYMRIHVFTLPKRKENSLKYPLYYDPGPRHPRTCTRSSHLLPRKPQKRQSRGCQRTRLLMISCPGLTRSVCLLSFCCNVDASACM